jgi:hypothetical protein
MEPKEVIRRSWENRKAAWPKGAESYYAPAFAPLETTWQPPSPEDWRQPPRMENTTVEFRKERSVNHRDGYYMARIVGRFSGEEVTVDEWLLHPTAQEET